MLHMEHIKGEMSRWKLSLSNQKVGENNTIKGSLRSQHHIAQSSTACTSFLLYLEMVFWL